MNRVPGVLLVAVQLALSVGGGLAADAPTSAVAAPAATAVVARGNCLPSNQPIEVVNTGNGYRFGADPAPNPTIVLCRRKTYTFKIAARGHPFWIKPVQTDLRYDAFEDGVTGNGIETGILKFAVPANAPATLYYNCEMHSSMTGRISIVD